MGVTRHCQCCMVLCGAMFPAFRADGECARSAVDEEILPMREKNVIQSHSQLGEVANDDEKTEVGAIWLPTHFLKYGDPERMLPRIRYPLKRDDVPKLRDTGCEPALVRAQPGEKGFERPLYFR